MATSIHVSTVTEDIIYNTIQIPYMTLTYVFTFLLRSESPSQVFFILLHWLATLSKPPDEKITLAYDNMCNLDRLRVAQRVLPLPPPMDSAWLNLEKIIDSTYYIFPITMEKHVGKSTIQQHSRPTFQISTLRPESKHSRAFCALCLRYIISSIYIAWY